MRVAARIRPWQWACLIGLLLFIVPLLRMCFSDYLAANAPQKALEWRPSNSEAQLRVAKAKSLEPAAKGSGEPLVDAMLSNSPLSGAAYALLGAEAVARNDKQRASALYTIAARRRPRDRLNHVWLADDAGSRGDLKAAIVHLDHLLTLSPGQMKAIFPTFASLLADPAGRSILVDYVATHSPSWRQGFLNQLASTADDPNLVSHVFNSLQTAPVPLTSVERELWSRRLVRDGHVQQAFYLWVQSLTPNQRDFLGNVFDGGFELAPTGSQFDWRFGSVPGALIRLQGGGGVTGRQALTIKFQYRQVLFNHVSQTLALPPGNYQLIGRIKLDSLQNERGIRWAVACAGSRAALGSTELLSGRSPWADFSTDFSVPAVNCSAQTLTLEIPARTRREQWVGGQVWFDDLAIRRRQVGPETALDSLDRAAL